MWKFWGLHFSELKSCASCVSFLGRKSVQKTAQLQSSEVRRTAAPQSSMTLPAGNTFGRGMIGPVTSMRQLLYYFKKNIQYFFILKGTLLCACPKRSFRKFRSKHRPFSPPPQGAQTSQTWSTAELTCHKATRPQGHWARHVSVEIVAMAKKTQTAIIAQIRKGQIKFFII